MIEIRPLVGLPEINPNDNLAAILRYQLRQFTGSRQHRHRVLVVTQKIVSKAEGRFVDLAQIEPGPAAIALAQQTKKDPRLVEVILAESREIVRAVPHVLITRHRSGLVMANAGIDRSNLGERTGEWVLLLPRDSDASAQALYQALDVPIVISDSFGRPWRHGVTGVAIGAAGLPSLDDHRGRRDRDGRVLEVTQIGLADMIATAAMLAMGEGAEGIPAALVSGVSWNGEPRPASALVRDVTEDLFR
jgi:coenzyme F420-0:L-glutamate ligase / coenzyme F420-1:gamma-L-glutamate ligase